MEAKFGAPSKNRIWSGVIGKIQNGTVDICPYMILLKERLRAVDHLKPVYSDR